MRIFFCWPGINGYMAACWRALIASGSDIFVIAFHPTHLKDSAFDTSIMEGIPHLLIDAKDSTATEICALRIREFQPGFVCVPTWGYPVYNRLVYRRDLKNARFVMGMDNPWRGTLRQRLGRFKVFGYLARIEKVLVPGERSFQFARRLGVPEKRIARCSLYGVDHTTLKSLLDRRAQQGWPRRFLFIGRYVEDKGLDILIAAYERYCAHYGRDSWTLATCGQGPLAHLLSMRPVNNYGFVQPLSLNDIWLNSGVLVHPPRLDHWPVVIVEACSAGLPVIASEACGSIVELIRPYYNGIAVPTGNVAALANAMGWMHEHYGLLPTLGSRSQELAAPFSAEAWTEQLLNVLADV
jgi:glycosyltransferase involved in cell wall biosynthesis